MTLATTWPWATAYAVELNGDAQDEMVCRCRYVFAVFEHSGSV
jgi:hypothetical protein